MDFKFLMFVLKESLPFSLFVSGLVLTFVLPMPYNMVISVIMVGICTYKAVTSFLDFMRFKYEMNQRDRERSWNILKDK